MCQIPLEPEELGKVACVDAEDYDQLAQHTWYVAVDHPNYCYAFRWITDNKIAFRRSMHEEVLRFKSSRHRVIDHINRNALDNRKENLRICSAQQNCWNRRPSQNKKSSKYKCVMYQRRANRSGKGQCHVSKPWRVRICRNRKESIEIRFADEYDAYLKSQEMLQEYHGDFAYLVPWTGYSNSQYPNKPINYQPT